MSFKKLFNLIYPIGFSCVNCGTEIFDDETQLCNICKNTLNFLSGKICLHCGEPITGSGNYCLHCKGKKFICDKIISPFTYSGTIKKLIIGLKYNNKKYYAQCLANYMATSFKKEYLPCDIITCVPICSKRLKERGYNQAELLGEHFAKNINKEFNPNILQRVKETPTQTKLTYTQRCKNMKNAFKVIDKNIINNKVVIIVDDVYTTGATITECAKKLKDAGALTIYGVTVAHTILEK